MNLSQALLQLRRQQFAGVSAGRRYLLLPAIVVSVGVVLPLVYLLVRAFEAEGADLVEIVFRLKNLRLLGNTALLVVSVVAVDTLLAVPLAWLTSRTSLKGRRFFTLLGVLPLAIPSYVMAYVLLSLGGDYGAFAHLFGTSIPRLGGYWGALIALSLYTFPYLFLNLRAALFSVDPALEESARSLGCRPWGVFYRVVIPQLRPAFTAGGLLVGLHVLGDFGVVSLMRYETFSYALYVQYDAAFDRVYAAWLALILLILAGGLLYTEARLLRGLRLDRAGGSVSHKGSDIQPLLGIWRDVAYLFLAILAFISVVVPIVIVSLWMVKGMDISLMKDLFKALLSSLLASAPAAMLSACFALPLAYMGVRYPSPFSRIMERVAYIGYATPPLAFALSLIFFVRGAISGLYQTIWVLIYAYTLHFLAEAIGPVRSALYHASPRLEEAARGLGYSALTAFFKATFPLLVRGVTVSVALVFLAVMKELPITFLLAPPGYETLATNVWSYTSEAMFAESAPYALTLLLFSALFVWVLLIQERSRDGVPA